MVTPGNPLKSHADLAPLTQRVTAARGFLPNPRIKVTGFEAEHGFAYSWQTIGFLRNALPDRRFVWLMGADNLRGFHRWERWQDIALCLPMAIYVRPGSAHQALASRAASALAQWRLDEREAPTLANRSAPAWIYLHGQQSPLSSSAIRAGQRQIEPK
jgi:nicotinate-nucleotide adenylyltransferase